MAKFIHYYNLQLSFERFFSVMDNLQNTKGK